MTLSVDTVQPVPTLASPATVAGSLVRKIDEARQSQNPALWRDLLPMDAVPANQCEVRHILPRSLGAERIEGSLVVPPGDVLPTESDGGLSLTLSGRVRSRLLLRVEREDSARGVDAGLWVHFVMSIEPVGQNDPLASIRVFQGSSHEETLVRFRDGGAVVLQEIRNALPPGGQPFLLSLGVKDGVASAYVDGRPRHRKPFALRSISGFVVDIWNQSDRECQVRYHALALQSGGERPFWMSAEDEALLADEVRADVLSQSRQEQWRGWHSMADFGSRLTPSSIAEAIAANRRAEPYLPALEDLLTQAAGHPQQSKTEPVPSPLITIRNAVVLLENNPGQHSIWHLGRGHQGSSRRVVNDISLDAYKGDIIGILGRNGAGKSTLLKTIVGAMPLTEGRIEIAGKPVLLRPGAGMNPALTGRQNIMKSGLYMNLHPKQIREMVPEIAAFAELEQHLDRPFKYYSDGMKSRLIFSIATAMPYDILLLDELLGAGDIGFQKRVTERLDQVIARAKLLFVVQHTFDFVISRCTKCLVMEDGRGVFFGDPQIAAELYREKVSS